jgi:hypothetical protein
VFGVSGKHFKLFEIPRETYTIDNSIDQNIKLEFSQEDRQVVLNINDSGLYAFDITE